MSGGEVTYLAQHGLMFVDRNQPRETPMPPQDPNCICHCCQDPALGCHCDDHPEPEQCDCPYCTHILTLIHTQQ